MERISAEIGALLAQEMPGEGRFAPIHVPPKGGDVVELAQPTAPVAEIDAGIGAELAHLTRPSDTFMPGSQQRDTARDRALLAIARICREKRIPLPSVQRLGEAFGCCPQQMSMVRKRLEWEGRLKTRSVTHGGTQRLAVVEVAPWLEDHA